MLRRNWLGCVVCLFFALILASEMQAVGSAPKTRKSPIDAQIAAGVRTISEDAARAHVFFLADDLLEGRRAGQRGAQIAQQYIVSHLRQLGLVPFLPQSFIQPFRAVARPTLHRLPRYYVEPDSVASISASSHHSLQLGNVLAMIPGTSSDEYVVVGAHFDHEGMNPDLKGDPIYNGADDNASGVSAVLQIAKAFVASGATPRRTVVFAFWDGEEFGLLGSRYFTTDSLTVNRTKGYLNFDMIGGNNKPDDPAYFVYFYTESKPQFGQWLRNDIPAHQLHLHPNYKPWDKPIGGSDQGSFARFGVPVIWYHTDGQPLYNTPQDEPATLNYPKLVDITRAAFLSAWHLANDDLR